MVMGLTTIESFAIRVSIKMDGGTIQDRGRTGRSQTGSDRCLNPLQPSGTLPANQPRQTHDSPAQALFVWIFLDADSTYAPGLA